MLDGLLVWGFVRRSASRLWASLGRVGWAGRGWAAPPGTERSASAAAVLSFTVSIVHGESLQLNRRNTRTQCLLQFRDYRYGFITAPLALSIPPLIFSHPTHQPFTAFALTAQFRDYGFIMGGNGNLLGAHIVYILVITGWVLAIMAPFFLVLRWLGLMRVPVGECWRWGWFIMVSHYGAPLPGSSLRWLGLMRVPVLEL